MVVRKKQLEAVRTASALNFDHEMVTHLAGYAPKLYELRGPNVFLEYVKAGRAKARALGFTCRGPIRMVLETMVTFGWQFDTDPVLPGIRAALKDRSRSNEMDRAEVVFNAIDEYWSEAVGERGELAIAALDRVGQIAQAPVPANTGELLNRLRACHPQRFEHAGEAAMRDLVTLAIDSCRTHKLTTQSGISLICALMFGFGHGILDDPLYPWIRSVIDDVRLSGPEERVQRIKDRSLVYIDHLSKHWKELEAAPRA